MKLSCTRLCSLFLCICLLFIGEKAFAGTITIQMQMSLTTLSGQIKVRITTANLGTEPARDLQAFLHIFDRVLTSEIIPHLDFKQTRSFHFQLPVPADKKGRFPFLGEVLYHDANQKPFSALAGDVFNLKHKAISELTGHVSDLTIKGKGKLPVQISNPLPHPLNGTVTLHLPHGLTSPNTQKYFVLDPNSKKTIEFQLFDRYEIGSAAVPVFCVLEYETNGVHETTIVQSTVHTKAFKNWFKQTKWWWLGGLIPIVLMWLGFLLLRKNENPNSDI